MRATAAAFMTRKAAVSIAVAAQGYNDSLIAKFARGLARLSRPVPEITIAMTKPNAIPPLRLTRILVDRLPPRTVERGPIILQDPPPHFYEKTAADILDRLDPPEEVWVFAAGSLIWNPRMEVVERRAAHLQGWRRAFCLTDRRFRGCPSTPGLMMSLDRGGSCSGVVLRMNTGSNPQAALVSLLAKEPPVPPELVAAQTEVGAVNAILFAADPSFPLYRPEPPVEELANILALAVGHVGTMAEYLLNTVTELERTGVHDEHLWQLQGMVAERLERLPEAIGAATDNQCGVRAKDPDMLGDCGMTPLTALPDRPVN